MELYQLRAFVAVAQAKNLSRAAKVLFASQPAVSAQIKALEDELGFPLFERIPKGMAITSEGENLLPRAQTILDHASELLDDARRLHAEPRGVLRIVSMPDPEKLRLGSFLASMSRRFPDLQIDLRHAASGAVRRGILSGEFDAGFVIGPSEESIVRRSLAPSRLVVVLPPHLEIADDAPWERIAEIPWIGTPEDCPFRILGQELFARMGVAPRMEFQVDIERTIVEMVASGMGASVLREDSALAAAREGRCRIWPGASIDTEFAFVWPKMRSGEPMLAAARSVVERIWSDS